jgi:hypothetical protein
MRDVMVDESVGVAEDMQVTALVIRCGNPERTFQLKPGR